MITFFGDIHGAWESFYYKLDKVPEDHVVIQVGDIGIWPQNWEDISLPRPVYFIDGNHEYFPYLNGISEVREIRPNLFYCPRGSVLELDGRRVGFLGGAESIDKYWRRIGISWFPEESISQADYYKALEMGSVDILVTHTPPLEIVKEVSMIEDLPGWVNLSAGMVSSVWKELGKPILVSGHMHCNYKGGNIGGPIYILDEFSTISL